HGIDAGRLRRFLSRVEAWAEHPVFAPLVERLQVHRGLLRPSVDGRDGTGLDDAGEIEELVALPERLLARSFGRALQNRNGIANLRHHARAACSELLGWKNLGSGKH